MKEKEGEREMKEENNDNEKGEFERQESTQVSQLSFIVIDHYIIYVCLRLCVVCELVVSVVLWIHDISLTTLLLFLYEKVKIKFNVQEAKKLYVLYVCIVSVCNLGCLVKNVTTIASARVSW